MRVRIRCPRPPAGACAESPWPGRGGWRSSRGRDRRAARIRPPRKLLAIQTCYAPLRDGTQICWRGATSGHRPAGCGWLSRLRYIEVLHERVAGTDLAQLDPDGRWAVYGEFLTGRRAAR